MICPGRFSVCIPSAVILAVASCLLAVAGLPLALAPGDKAPDMGGNRVDNSFFRTDYTAHKATVVNFWATWCEPCKDEMPALQELHTKHGQAGLQIVGVLHDNVNLQTMQEFADALGVSYDIVKPRRQYAKRWTGVGILPTTFLIDGSGKILRRYVGATEEQIDGLVTDIEATLAGEPLGPLVIPDEPAVATEEDRLRAKEKEKEKD
jgi:thiol-disulfide isomerase/thioredoxin